MSDLPTHEEYLAIAANMSFPVNAFIDGKFQKPRSGRRMKSIDPATGETLAEVAACDAKDVDFAVGKAREAFDSGVWSRMHHCRSSVCSRGTMPKPKRIPRFHTADKGNRDEDK